ncbi:Uncharacterised protein [Escherichia coli]|nr:Uncharacterised protein [Escherichia coli]
MNLLEIVNAGILRQLSNRLVAVKTEVTNQLIGFCQLKPFAEESVPLTLSPFLHLCRDET